MHVDYYFTPVSPWVHLGHARFAQLLHDTGATVSVRPVDYGRIFPVSGGLPLPQRAPQRQAYRLVELRRFAGHLGVPMQVQPTFFPVSADLAAKLIVVVDQAQGAMAALDLAGRCGRAVWEQQRNLAEPATLAALLAEAGLPPTWLDRAADPKIAQTLAGYTQQAIDAGVFGAPSYVVDGEIFWGQDRLDFLARRLAPG
jgi:carboxymethylenebutenolidase